MQKSETVTLTINEGTLKKMRTFYESCSSPSKNPYIDVAIKEKGVTISIFKQNKKGETKVLFQGENALKEARIWNIEAKANTPKISIPLNDKVIRNRYPQIGSDEVGTGDVFGPIIVVAAFVKKEDVSSLLDLGITDSKKMNDEYILSIGPNLIHRYEYSELALDNLKYNEIHDEFNMNQIKAKMHNRCLLNLKKKHPEAFAYQDQFAPERLYYSYLNHEKEVLRNINFKTKGESSFVSVALASVIARYAFLRSMQKMDAYYELSFPLGAGERVDEFLKSFKEKYGKDELKKVAKLNFKNLNKLT